LGRQRQVWLIPNADKRVGLQVKLWNPLRTRAIPEHFCGGDSLQRGATLHQVYAALPLCAFIISSISVTSFLRVSILLCPHLSAT